MADRLNPGDKSAAESDYDKKFNRNVAEKQQTGDADELKKRESTPDGEWKTNAKKKSKREESGKGVFGFAGKHAGAVRSGSAFGFITLIILFGLWYSSIFAPNIIMVNIKEMYTNDLADATIALDTYYKKLMNYKIGRPQCGEQESIKCKLSTMSRKQKQDFEKRGFTVVGTKVKEDNRDDGSPGNELPEERYQVMAILPPAYTSIINELKTQGISLPANLLSGNPETLAERLGNSASSFFERQTNQFSDPTQYMPIVTGDMLWLYAQISSANKAQVYGVFNPKSSFFMDKRFIQRLKSKYDLTKDITVSGQTEQQVNKSFDRSMTGSNEGVDIFGRPNAEGGVGLGSLRNPIQAVNMQLAARNLANVSTSYVGLQCAWYSYAKTVTNNAKTAKAHTVARFAMQYLKAADQIKAGTSEDVTIGTLSSKLAQSTGGGYNGPNATDSTMYKAIVYNNLPIPSPFGLLYYLDTFDLIGAMLPAWSQIMITAQAVGTASGAPGTLSMPPASLGGGDRDYCLSGETTDSHIPIKNDECRQAITASAPLGLQGAISGAIEVGHETCPPPQYDPAENRFRGEFITQPSLKATDAPLTTYVSGLFSANVIAWANVMYLLFTSNTKGVAASDAIFAGTGEILGDMAMSRGMMPSNAAYMTEYLALKDEVDKEYSEVARYNARQDPFDPYNKFSFLGSIVHGITPVYNDDAPLYSSVANAFSLVKDGLQHLNPSADAIYYLQPAPFNPLRLSCPDPEYLAIGIMADTACNVRYSFTRLELAAQVDTVLDYMTQSHPDAVSDGISELEERRATADVESGAFADVTRQLETARAASNQPYIDERTGKAMPGSEYEKYLDYCVNRQDPWGRTGVALHRDYLPDDVRADRGTDKPDDSFEPASPQDKGYPYEEIPRGIAYSAVTEGTKMDQDWYSGKKCTEQSEMLTNFRAYTMICSVDGSLSGGIDCTDNDNSGGYNNEYFTSNDILYMSW